MATSSGDLTYPLYIVRQWNDIDTEGKYRVISTYRAKYVLDCPELEGDYWARRMKLLSMELPYRLYPLNVRITGIRSLLQQVVKKRRFFIDGEGKVHNYKPQRFYPLVYERITSRWATTTGTYAFKCRGSSTTFINDENHNYSHLGYIEVEGRQVLYELCWKKKRDTRRKL
jgi:hypothetical protein